ncbi:TPA: hypothetical protein ACN1M9_001436 [Enterococcus faecalis]|uniref:hypothetical protein n=2 Tax=Enterococcus faecalis TaxID=1351 RepID=UPI001925D052|nr:hypothetical protein [Enterococcus faecalis]EKF8799172.1 hypothetical protein [Enterococcus faecalis]EKK0912069.1 hypothetical protein [Enterococcus faecalis]MEB8139879.1 hypothetical protein [Enterococcus faecalis]UNT40088.1 hypothetical protein MPM64_14810 [Enterococcus faecalis]HAP4452853.1 hypothetical protein [Enterococcus faecalis]
MVAVGEAYLGKISYLDGVMPSYYRPYLVVEVLTNGIHVLNVSSSKGKETKLLYASNYELTKFNPPFVKPSFVKLDSKTFIPDQDLQTLKLLSNGQKLNSRDLNNILAQFKSFSL